MRRRIDAPVAALSGLVIGSLVAGPITSVRADEPFYRPAGELVPKSGTGRVDETLYSPDMRFPIEEGPAYPNSQVYGVGGYHGPSGGQCDNRNYSYPWWDNYCETRSWSMPMCPAGTGHQGQDIRPQTCKNAAHWTVSTVAGTVTNVPTNSSQYATYIVGADGTRYDYLHGADTPLAVGDKVTKGQRVDLVSNKFGGTPTTIHLHFNIRQDVGGYGFVYAPPYASLVHSYKQLMDLGSAPPTGAFAQASCEALVGWAHDEDTPEEPVTAVLYFDGHPSDPDNAGSGVEIVADLHDEALCESLGSCAHAFALEVPRSLRDGLEHRVYAFALDDGQGPQVELENSPQTFVCDPPALPPGIRRWIPTPEHLAAWQLSPFWELAKVSDAELAAIPVGQDLGAEPTLLRADDGSPEVWILDHHLRRRIPSAEIAARWSLEIDAAELMPAGDLAAIPEGPPLRPEPWMVKGSGPWIYLLDDPLCGPGDLADPLCAITPDDSDSDSDSDSSGDTDSGSDSGTDSVTGGGSDSESAGSGGESADPEGGPALPQGYGEGGEDGCGCRSVTPGSRGSLWGLAWLLGIGLTRRRRQISR